MRLRTVTLVALVGCNQAFGLTEPTELDSGLPDTDGDGFDDFHDNCPGIANPSQSDLDGDLIGDACDNCPLVANANQKTSGDPDKAGDACDPHPDVDGECLVLLDTFADPTAFATNWTVLQDPSDPPGVANAVGQVRFEPPIHDKPVAIVARDLTGLFDVEVMGTIDHPADGSLGAAALSSADATNSYACISLGVLAGATVPMAPNPIYFGLSSQPIDNHLLLRLAIDEVDPTNLTIRCRVDYGVAVGSSAMLSAMEKLDGGPGVSAYWEGTSPSTLTVTAVAVYRAQPGTECPAAILR